MKKYGILIFVSIVISFNSFAGSLKIAACDGKNGTAAVTMVGVSGKWIGLSAKKSNGEIVDAAPVKLGMIGSGGKMLRFDGSRDIVKVRASSWKKFDKKKNRMESRLDDTGWVSCN